MAYCVTVRPESNYKKMSELHESSSGDGRSRTPEVAPAPSRNLTLETPTHCICESKSDLRKTLWSDSYEVDLYDMRDTLRAHAWAHDKRASDFKNYNIFYLVVLAFLGASISAASTILTKVYGDVAVATDAAIFVAQIGGALVTAFTTLSIAFDPGRMRGKHITAVINKTALEGEIAEVLHKDRVDRRWLADDFFKHVNGVFAVMDAEAPYLPMGLIESAPVAKVRRPRYIQELDAAANTPDNKMRSAPFMKEQMSKIRLV